MAEELNEETEIQDSDIRNVEEVKVNLDEIFNAATKWC